MGNHHPLKHQLCVTLCLAMGLFLVLTHVLLGLGSLPPAPVPVPVPVLPQSTYRGYTSPYSFDADAAANPAWMGALPDRTRLASLSIPGTHDTLTHGIDDSFFQCQNTNLSAQLAAGVRYIDVRARLRRNDSQLYIYHGDRYTGYSYADVLQVLFAFLDAHPSEGVLMRLKEEGAPILDDVAGDDESHNSNSSSSNSDNRTRPWSFEDAFNRYRRDDPRTAPGAARHFFDRPPPADVTATTLGELRGRVLVLQDFPSSSSSSSSSNSSAKQQPPPPPPPSPYGVPWSPDNAQLQIEDYWLLPDVAHLEDKWAAIRANLDAAAGAGTSGKLYFSHLSATGAVLPIGVAAGPLPEKKQEDGGGGDDAPVVRGMNDRTGAYLEQKVGSGTGATGVVIIDFPGQRLITSILRRNDWITARKLPRVLRV